MNFEDWKPWLPASIAVVAAFLAGLVVRSFLLRRLQRVFASTKTDLDDLLLSAVSRHLAFWCLLGGVSIAAQMAPITDGTQASVHRYVRVVFVVSLTLAAASFLAGLVERGTRRADGTSSATSLTRHVVRGLVLAVGAMLVLQNLGVEIGPLMAALGIGSLAVALALQPTLSNLFAGLHIAIARPVRVGDFVELDNGTQGFVVDIGWRATRIRELPNDIVIVPNAKIVEMVLKNYDMPEAEQALVVQVGVAYGSDLEAVERVTVEVAKELQVENPGAVTEFDPFVRFHTFGDSSINFSVILRVKAYTDRYLMLHDFVKRLKRRYDAERIEIPFPQRVLSGKVEAVLPRVGA